MTAPSSLGNKAINLSSIVIFKKLRVKYTAILSNSVRVIVYHLPYHLPSVTAFVGQRPVDRFRLIALHCLEL